MNRGGSWNNSGTNCRSAYRNYNTPDNRNNNIGLRVLADHRVRRAYPPDRAESRPLSD